MSDDRYLGITFPFQEDLKGKYLKLTNIDKDAVRSNLSNLITTMKGERLYKPDFGTNVMRFLFEPMDDVTYGEIREEIIGAVTKYLKEIEVQNVEINTDEQRNFVGLRISYTITDGVFREKDEISLLF
jgi:phage baseplate assembly protein W